MFPTEKLIDQAQKLKFDKNFETKYKEESSPEANQRYFFLAISLFSIALILGIMDYFAFPVTFAKIKYLRFFSLLLAIITVVLCLRSEIAAGINREYISLANIIFFSIAHVFIISLANQSETGYSIYFAGLFIVFIASSTFFPPLSFLFISGLTTIIFNIAIAHTQKITYPGEAFNRLIMTDVFLFAVIVLATKAAHLIQSSGRKEFVYTESIENHESKEEFLFHRILPDITAQKIKENLGATANGYENTTVLFAEITGFAKLAQTIPQSVLADYLNEFEKEFDVLAKKYDVEKIVTDGEEFWLLSGLPEYIPDHAEIMTDMAIEMKDAVARVCKRTSKQFQVRIGINSGPVVACWFGKDGLYIYDLHGDTLKTGSAMESHGVTGEIQISESTHKLLDGKYEMYERGQITIAGTNTTNAYLVKRKL